MTHQAPADTDALAYSLPRDAFYNLLRDLQRTLPPPPDRPEDRKRRNHAIIAQISALRPNDSAEAIFAAQVVAATEQWNDCLHLAQLHRAAGNLVVSNQARAQAASMMRQAQSAMRVLLKVQAERRKLYADPETTDAAERIEHVTMVMLAEALVELSEPQTPETPAPIITAAPLEPAPAPAVTATPVAEAHIATVTARPAQPAAAAQADRTEPDVSKTASTSRKHKTETTARQSERPKESAARLAMIDKFLFAPRGPGCDRPMFFPDKSAAKPAKPGESSANDEN